MAEKEVGGPRGFAGCGAPGGAYVLVGSGEELGRRGSDRSGDWGWIREESGHTLPSEPPKQT